MKVLWTILSFSVLLWEHGYAQDDVLYSPRYDNLNIDVILSSFRLVTNYVECLLNRKPCPPEGKDLKRILPEALRTKCSRCSPRQKENALKVIRKLYEDYPEYYKSLSEKWDPSNEYNRRFQEYLQNEQFNNIGSNDFSNNRIDSSKKRSNGTTGSDFENDQSQINVQSVPISSLNGIPTESKPAQQPTTQAQTSTQPTTQRETTQRQTQPASTRRTTTTSTTSFAPPLAQSDILNRFGAEDDDKEMIIPAEQSSPPVAPTAQVFVSNRQTIPTTYRPNPTNPQTNAPTTRFFVTNPPTRLYITTQRPYQAPQAPQAPSRPQTTRLQPVTVRLPQQSQNAPATSTIRQVIVRQPSPQNPSFQATNPSSFVTRRPMYSTVNINSNTEILDNFFISPIANFNPNNNINGPIANIFNSISNKITNTAEAIAGMVRNTVQIFVGGRQQ